MLEFWKNCVLVQTAKKKAWCKYLVKFILLGGLDVHHTPDVVELKVGKQPVEDLEVLPDGLCVLWLGAEALLLGRGDSAPNLYSHPVRGSVKCHGSGIRKRLIDILQTIH